MDDRQQPADAWGIASPSTGVSCALCGTDCAPQLPAPAGTPAGMCVWKCSRCGWLGLSRAPE